MLTSTIDMWQFNPHVNHVKKIIFNIWIKMPNIN